MATIKSHTDLSQSKKLAKILPIESADMGWYYNRNPNAARNQMWVGTKAENADIPCWSLAALLDVLPNGIITHKDSQNGNYHCCSTYAGTYIKTDNPVDACVEMIEKLHKENLL